MIARVWRGVTREADAEEYGRYIVETGFAAYGTTPGNRGAWLLRRDSEGRSEFLTLSLWENREAIVAFAGSDIDRASYYLEDERFLLEKEDTVKHFEIVAEARGLRRASGTVSAGIPDRGADMAEDESRQRPDPHAALNQPASDPDPTEWPDPYDKRPDPRDPEAEDEEMDFGDIHTPTGATSTSEPNHEVDIEVDPRRANPHERD